MSTFVVVCDTATMHEYLTELKSSVTTTYTLPLVPPTQPRKCSISPGKCIPVFPLFNFICHKYCKLQPPPCCCTPPPDAHTHMYTYTQWLSTWQTHACLICHSCEHMHAHTHLSDYLIDKHGHIKPYSSRLLSRRRKNKFPKLAQHECKERD